jgi:hypothetical protein
MAQADYVVANDTGAAVRSDLNGQLAAIVSNNSGATEPATMYAYQWWADTTTGLLKLRNSANSAWIELRQLDGEFTTVPVEDGSAGAPSIYFKTSGTDTGLYSPGADQVGISTGGTARVIVDSNGATLNGQGDLRFADSDSSHFIALQAPATITTDVTLTLPSADGTSGQFISTDGSGTLSFATPASGASNLADGSAATPSVNYSADTNTGIFRAGNDLLAFSTGGTERAQFDANGRLLIGTSTSTLQGSGAAATQQIATFGTVGTLAATNYGSGSAPYGSHIWLGASRGSTAGSATAVANGDRLGEIRFFGGDGTDLDSQAASISCYVDGTPGADDLPGRIVLATTADGASGPTERMRINNTGTLSVYGPADNPSVNFSVSHGPGTHQSLAIYSGGSSTTSLGTKQFFVQNNGDVRNTNNSYGAISDVKLKENIVNASSQWSDIKALQVRKYNLKEETGHQTHTQIGLVAQEVELVSPGLVSESPDRDEEGNDLGTVTKSVNYSVLYMKAVKALQEAIAKIEALEGMVAVNNITIDEQQHQLSTLEARLTALESA